MTEKKVRVALKDATRKQLREFAIEVLGLPLANLDHQNVIIAKIRESGWDKDFIEVREGADSPGATPARRAGQVEVKTPEDIEARDSEYFEIEIPVSDAPGGGEPVYVSVNGIGQYVHRGKTQWVRRPYIEALSHAIATHYRQEPDMKTPPEPYEVHIYPFMVKRRGLTHDQVAPLIAAFQQAQAGR